MEGVLVGEHLALDLINTRLNTPDGEVDLLAEPAIFDGWLAAQRDRLVSAGAPFTAAELVALRALRDRIEEAVALARQGLRPPAAALRALSEAQRAAPAYRELGWDGTAVTATPRRRGDRVAQLLAELAGAAADLLTSPAISSVRQCEGPGCRLLFLPAHPRRRWCSPTLCGNRVRVSRYYKRHRSPGAPPGSVVQVF